MRLSQPDAPPRVMSGQRGDLASAVLRAAARILRRRAPPNWPREEWREELLGCGLAAALDAETRYAPGRGERSAFLYFAALSAMRRRWEEESRYARHCPLSLDALIDGDTDADADCGHGRACEPIDRRAAVSTQAREALDDLPADVRPVAEAYYLGGETQAEIAARLDLSQPAVSKRLHKARTLDADDDEAPGSRKIKRR